MAEKIAAVIVKKGEFRKNCLESRLDFSIGGIARKYAELYSEIVENK
jgi:hypothetical protein